MKDTRQPLDKGSHLELSHLYHGLARDAFRVANRQYRYSKEAFGEKKFSDKDYAYARKRGLVMSALDDEHESDICKEFSLHRKALADLYERMGKNYEQQAQIHMRLARRK